MIVGGTCVFVCVVCVTTCKSIPPIAPGPSPYYYFAYLFLFAIYTIVYTTNAHE